MFISAHSDIRIRRSSKNAAEEKGLTLNFSMIFSRAVDCVRPPLTLSGHVLTT
jgi:hypothetical protein